MESVESISLSEQMTALEENNNGKTSRNEWSLNPNPIGGGGPIQPPPVVFFAVHLDRLEFRVQTS